MCGRPQPDLAGAPPVADLLRNGLDGLLRDLHPTNSISEGISQHTALQQNSHPDDGTRHDAPRDNGSREFENDGHDNPTTPVNQDRPNTDHHDTGNQAHQSDASADHVGRTDGHPTTVPVPIRPRQPHHARQPRPPNTDHHDTGNQAHQSDASADHVRTHRHPYRYEYEYE